jgi:hypothetical protein
MNRSRFPRGDQYHCAAGLELSGGAFTAGLLSEPFRHPMLADGEPDPMEGFEMRLPSQKPLIINYSLLHTIQ